MKKLNHNQFTLRKVKKAKTDTGLSIDYTLLETAGEETYHQKYSIESDKLPHPDLIQKLTACKKMLVQVFGFGEKMNENIEVSGISIKGIGDAKGAVITGSVRAVTNQKMAINSHHLKFNSEQYGFETELDEICNDVEVECFAFLFEGKQAQLSLAFEDQEEDGVQEGMDELEMEKITDGADHGKK